MAYVIAKEKEGFESLYRRFRKKVIDEHIVADYREHTFFMKPSEKRRKYEKEIQKKIRKANARRNNPIDREL